MGSVFIPENNQASSLSDDFDFASFCAETRSSIDCVIYTLSIISNMTVKSPSVLQDYALQVTECERRMHRLKMLESSNPMLQKCKNECLAKFAIFEADSSGEFCTSSRASSFDFKTEIVS